MTRRTLLVLPQSPSGLPVDQEHRQPYPHKPPYIAPYKAKALTIAAAFPCKGGFVFCADQLMAHGMHSEPGSFAHYEKKVFGQRGNYYSALLCTAGTTDYLKSLKHTFFDRLKKEEVEGEGLPLSAVERVLDSSLMDLQGMINGELDLQTLVAVMDDSGQALYFRSDKRVVRPVKEPEILGIGEASLVRYLIDSIYRPDFTLRQAITLAALVVYAAKRYCAQYCGGDTDIYTLAKGEFITDWKPVDTPKIEALEQLFQHQAGRHLLQLVNKGVTLL